jgi:hypothetical protein
VDPVYNEERSLCRRKTGFGLEPPNRTYDRKTEEPEEKERRS